MNADGVFDPNGFWHEWRGQDGKVTMLIRRLFRWRGLRIDLHKFVNPDRVDCFHTHPAWAIRIVLWRGYIEEDYRRCFHEGRLRTWWPGRIGIVSPEFTHRICRLRGGPSYSLWIRFRVVADVQLVGHGWTAKERADHAAFLSGLK